MVGFDAWGDSVRFHRPRREGSFWLIAGAFVSLPCAANIAATLYGVYAEKFGFSSATLALIFATYTLLLVPALLVCGQLSDRFGRRPIILCGLATAIVALVLFAVAHSVAWLFAARAVQALSIAMVTGAAVAALVELDSNRNPERPALVATLAMAGGSALGPLVGGAIAQWAPDQLVTPYVVAIALIAVFVVLVPLTAEPLPSRSRRSWRLQRPNVPREIRGAFTRIAVTAAAVWSVAMLFLSVLPSYAKAITGSRNLALLGAIAAVVLVVSCLSQVVGRRAVARTGALAGGLLLLTLGLVGLVLAQPLDAAWTLVVGAVVAGAGHGIGFLAAQRDLNRIAPDERRGEVNAAFFTCIYLGVSVSVIGVGLLADAVSLYVGVVVFSALAGIASLAVAVWHLLAGRTNRDHAAI